MEDNGYLGFVALIAGMLVVLGLVLCLDFYNDNGYLIPKVEDTAQAQVRVKVVNVESYRRGPQIIPVGKSITTIPGSMVYKVAFESGEDTIIVDDEELYHRFKNRIGEYVSAVVRVNIYTDGSEEKEIVSIE